MNQGEREMKDLKKEEHEYNNARKDIKILCVLSVIFFLLILPASFFPGYLFFHVLNLFFIFFTLLLNKLLSSLKYKYQSDSSSMSIIGQKMIRFEFILFSILAIALGVWTIQFTKFNLVSVFLVILFAAILFFRTVKCLRGFSGGTAIKGEMIFRFYQSYLFFVVYSYVIALFYMMYLFAKA